MMGGFENYLLESLAHFHYDPPNDEYQGGYFDALAYMADHFDVIKIDDPVARKPTRPRLTVIDGGKK